MPQNNSTKDEQINGYQIHYSSVNYKSLQQWLKNSFLFLKILTYTVLKDIKICLEGLMWEAEMDYHALTDSLSTHVSYTWLKQALAQQDDLSPPSHGSDIW